MVELEWVGHWWVIVIVPDVGDEGVEIFGVDVGSLGNRETVLGQNDGGHCQSSEDVERD